MRQSLRVWHLLSNRWNSAITEYALSAARALELSGYTSIFSPLAGSPALRRAESYGLPCEAVAGFGIKNLPQLRRLASSLEPAAIIVYGGPETFLSRFLPLAAGTPRVRFRGQALPPGQRAWLFRLSHSHLAAIITPGSGLGGAVAHLAGCHLPVTQITLGLDSDTFYREDQLPIALSPAAARPEIVLLGRLDPVKGHQNFLAIFAALLKRCQQETPRLQPRLHIIGEEANVTAQDIAAWTASQGLRWGEDVLLTCRRVDNLRQLMNRAAVGVIASVGSEEICRVAEEFLLCGCPIFVSGVGALKDTLFAGAGACYEGQTIEAAAASLHELLRVNLAEGGDGERQRRAEQARSLFSLTTMGGKLQTVLFPA